MPTFEIICAATATIRETWHVEGDTAETAREIMEDHAATGEGSVSFVSQEIVGDETDRAVLTVLDLQRAPRSNPLANGSPVDLKEVLQRASDLLADLRAHDLDDPRDIETLELIASALENAPA